MLVLEWVVSHPTSATVRRTAEALNLDSTTCYRLVNTLVGWGYLTRGERGLLRPGPAFIRLWPIFLQQGIEQDLALAASKLRDDTRESAYVNIWDGEELVLVLALDGLSNLRVSGYEAGYREASHVRASGKAVLAYLPGGEVEDYIAAHQFTKLTPETVGDEHELRLQLERVRSEGVAREEGELFAGTCSIAAPLFGPLGRVVGGIGLSAPAPRYEARLEGLRDRVLSAGEEASRILGYRGPYPL